MQSQNPEAHTPIVGAARSEACARTLSVFVNKLRQLSPLAGSRLLDVGCGDGCFTIPLGTHYAEVHGIDVQEQYVNEFKARVAGDPRYHVSVMSASHMSYPDGFFDTLITIETIEHIAELPKAIREFRRVLKSGGECLVTCPNRWFPFENHGIRWRGRTIVGRIPLITYIPPLHDRISLARVFTVSRLDRLFGAQGFKRTHLAYLWPTFEHGGNPVQRHFRRLFSLMRRMEESPLRFLGTSIVARFQLTAL